MTKPLFTIGTASLLALATAFLLSVSFSKSYWGYFFARPSPTKVASYLTSVDGLSFIKCAEKKKVLECVPDPESKRSLESARASCTKDAYYCLNNRLLVALGDLGILPGDPDSVEPNLISALPHVLQNGKLLGQPEQGYEPLKLSGIVVSGADATGARVALAGVSGGQVSNDHYPYVELAIAQTPELRVLKLHRFFYDFAGIEGLEWFSVFIGLSSIGLLVTIPSTVLVSFLIQLARRKRAV
jgi:hypothetical protein